MSSWGERRALAVRMRIEGHTFKEMGKAMGNISGMRASQIFRHAIYMWRPSLFTKKVPHFGLCSVLLDEETRIIKALQTAYRLKQVIDLPTGEFFDSLIGMDRAEYRSRCEADQLKARSQDGFRILPDGFFPFPTKG